MKVVRELISYILIIIIVVIIRSYIITPAQVVGASMEPTLEDHEIILLNKIGYRINNIKRFDIVIIKMPDTKSLIKRVIGLPGEKLEYKDGKLYINNRLVNEPSVIKALTNDYQLTKVIPQNNYFVMGDNRDNSIDSRIFGIVDRKNIIGNTNFVIYPFNKFGKVK